MKPLLFLIPGTLCDRALWQGVEQQLQRVSRPVFLEVPEAGDMASVIEQLSVQIEEQRATQPYALLGFSMGGYLASALACRSAEALSHLMLVGNLPKALPESELEQREQISELISRMGYSGITRARAKQFLHPQCPRVEEIVTLIQEMDNRFGSERVVQQLRDLARREDLRDQLLELSPPVWLCHGDFDNLVDSGEVASLVARGDRLQQHIVADSGHMLPLEQPEAFVNLVENWLEC